MPMAPYGIRRSCRISVHRALGLLRSTMVRRTLAMKQDREYCRDPRAEDRADHPVGPLIDLAEAHVKAVKPTVDRVEPLIDIT